MVLSYNQARELERSRTLADDDDVQITGTGTPSPVLGQPPIGAGPGPGTSVPDDDDDGQSLADRYEEYYDSRRARRTLPDWIDRYDGGDTDDAGGSNGDGDGGAFPGFFANLPGLGNNPIGQFLAGNTPASEEAGGFGEWFIRPVVEPREFYEDKSTIPENPEDYLPFGGKNTVGQFLDEQGESQTGRLIRTLIVVIPILVGAYALGQLFNINVG